MLPVAVGEAMAVIFGIADQEPPTASRHPVSTNEVVHLECEEPGWCGDGNSLEPKLSGYKIREEM